MRTSARLGFFASLLTSVALAQPTEFPLTNWTVPPYTQSSSGGLTPMTDATPPRVFIGVQPCRLVDTRAGSAFPAGFGVPSLAPGVPRNFDLDNGPCPGLPAGIDAYSLNVTVTNTAGPGHLVIYPQGGAQPTVSSINYVAGETIANAVIVPAGAGGGVTVVAGVSGTNLLIDINGYFSDTLGTPETYLELRNNNPTFVTAYFKNLSTSCSGVCGIQVETAGGHAIAGFALESAGTNFGVLGNTESTTDAAGVFGRTAEAPFPNGYSPAGVRGSGDGIGVLGISQAHGVIGDLVNASDALIARGILGFEAGSPTKYGVWAASNYGGSGAKFFVEPHPNDASKVIRYVSLEGPEAGTYFRGRGKFERGMARIQVPEDFRMVTDEEGLSVQVTPIGGMASVGVMKVDLNDIVVQSSRNLEFYYLVQGVRRTHKHLTPIGEGNEYRPERADSTMPAYLTDGQKQLLIQNGTYGPDGTVNMETAQRLGWDKVWAERDRAARSLADARLAFTPRSTSTSV